MKYGFNRGLAVMNNRRNVCDQSNVPLGGMRVEGRLLGSGESELPIQNHTEPHPEHGPGWELRGLPTQSPLPYFTAAFLWKVWGVKTLNGRTQRNSRPRQPVADVVDEGLSPITTKSFPNPDVQKLSYKTWQSRVLSESKFWENSTQSL